MTFVYQPTAELPPPLRFSNAECLRLFSEGVQQLQRYSVSADSLALNLALERFSKCTQRFPSDILPRFYLGVAKTLTSYDGADEAIDHFRAVESAGTPSLRLIAAYNRAIALIAKYSGPAFEEAEHILVGVLATVRALRNARDDSSELVEADLHSLYCQAVAKLQFIRVRQKLWAARETLTVESHEPIATELRGELAKFQEELTETPPAVAADDIWAYHHNNVGLLDESCAYLYRATDPRKSRDYAERSLRQYQMALAKKNGWPNAMANLARVEYEFLDKKDEAIAILEQLAQGLQQAQYAHLLLGRAYLDRGDKERARQHLEQAPKIPEAVSLLKSLD